MDKLVWKAEKNGCYSVRSACRICIEDVINDHLRKPGYWSGIWRLKVPPKIKNFGVENLQRLLSDASKVAKQGC
jgi:hypothetical protein